MRFDFLADHPGTIVAIAAIAVGFSAYWANPQRLVNRGFFGGAFVVGTWLFCLDHVLGPGSHAPLVWTSLTSLSGAAIVIPVWFVTEAILDDHRSATAILWSGRWWIAGCVVLSVIRQTNLSIDRANFEFWIYVAGLAGMYGWLCWRTIFDPRRNDGTKIQELKIVAIGGGGAGFAMMLLLILRTAMNRPETMRLAPLAIVLFYAAIVAAMTTSRIFDARQLVVFVLQRIAVVGLATAFCVLAIRGLSAVIYSAVAWPIGIAATLWLSAQISRSLDRLFEFYPEAKSAREAALRLSQSERHIEPLESSFRQVLAGWGHTGTVLLFSGPKLDFGSVGPLRGDEPATRAVRAMQWATPERLRRERATPDRMALGQFLSRNGLAALVFQEGASRALLIGVGPGASRRPYTYPQVQQLIELAAIMGSALERAHFSAKAQHAEQLATLGLLGASVAHEIQNPLVAIRTFVQMLPAQHDNPAFREKFFRLIGEEVQRVDQLTRQLLELASPRLYTATVLDLHPVVVSALTLVEAKAAARGVRLQTEFAATPDRVRSDASAVKQVVLNLCFNAIQAMEQSAPDNRKLSVTTRTVPVGVELAITDSGPGVAPEIAPRLFQPFQTTKASGFGLGLSICREILDNLEATISVDAPVQGAGATFRVVFPRPDHLRA